ncbi:MAG: HAMP domain-containing protein [Gammaproteobacteria bacterium]
MSETIAITGKSVKLFKGHYTSIAVPTQKSKDESLSARVSAATIHLDTSVWPDGKTYVMRCHAGSGFKGIGTGWTICVYESATTVLARAGSVQRHIFAIIFGLDVIAVAIGVRVIYHIMRRLIAIARAADDLRTGATTELHIPAGEDEIARIGQAFNLLVQVLQAEQQSLRALNAS